MSTAASVEALTRDEWHTIVDAGHLDDQPVELLGGRKVAMSPEGRRHLAVVLRLAQQLRDQLDPAILQVSEGHPFALSDISEPEPDIAVVRGDILEILDRGDLPGPADVTLVIEVSHSSVAKDLGPKAALYLEAGIARYLVVDLTSERFVLHHRADTGWSIEVSALTEPLHIDIGDGVTLTLSRN